MTPLPGSACECEWLLLLVVEEQVDELADLGVAGLRGTQRLVRMDRVGVPATFALAAQVALVDQLGDDPLGSTLGDVQRRSDVPQPNGRILRDHHHHPGVVGDERPCTHLNDFPFFVCPVFERDYPDPASVIKSPFTDAARFG